VQDSPALSGSKKEEIKFMRLVRRLMLAAAMIMAVAPVIGMASDPFPQCYPCPDSVAK
jgi:hypothetical protein